MAANLRRQLETELLPQLAEVRGLLEQNPDDEEIRGLLNDTEEEVAKICREVNAQDRAAGFLPGMLCQMLWDENTWYTCQVLDIVEPSRTSRIVFKVKVLGYNNVEQVFVEKLRRWKPFDTPLTPGLAVHAIWTGDGRFHPATLTQLTPNNTVMVTFSDVMDASGKPISPCEIPLTEILLGKVFRELKRNVVLSDEDLKKRDEHRKLKKRERQRTQRELQGCVVAQNASDWKAICDEDEMEGFDRFASKPRKETQ